MPTQEQLNNIMNPLVGNNTQPNGGDLALHQFTYKGGVPPGAGQVNRNTTMQGRNQGYQNNASSAAGPASGYAGVSPKSEKRASKMIVDLD